MLNRKKLLVLLALLAATATAVYLLTGDGAGRQGEKGAPADSTHSGNLKDTLTVATWEEPNTLDPQHSNRIAWFAVQRQIYDRLVHEDSEGNISPMLAKEWEFIDDKTIRFKLRDDVYFHNGEKMTAEDVRFTISRATKTPECASTFKSFNAAGTTVVDDYTIDIKLNEPYAPIFNTLGNGRGNIVCKKAMEKMGEDAYARSPIGTGPYKFVEWVSGTIIRLERFDDYYAEKAITKNVNFKIIPESGNRIIELETGDADIAYNMSPNDAPRIKGTNGLEVLSGPSYRYITITFNMQDKILKDVKVREALACAIDVDSIVKAIYGDQAQAANGLMPPLTPGFKEMPKRPFDIEKSKQLLAEAGCEKLKIKYVLDPGEEYIRISEVVQNMWKQIGVETELFTSDTASYLAQGNKFEVAIRTGNANEASNTFIIYESAFGDRLQSNDDKMDELLARAKTIYDDEKRYAVYGEFQDYVWGQYYTIPICFSNVIYGVNSNVEGFKAHPLMIPELKTVSVH